MNQYRRLRRFSLVSAVLKTPITPETVETTKEIPVFYLWLVWSRGSNMYIELDQKAGRWAKVVRVTKTLNLLNAIF